MEQQLSVCIPTYNRLDMTLDAFDKIYADQRVHSIVISDDCSDLDIFEKLRDIVAYYPKVILHRNSENRDCYANKKQAVSLSPTPYCILLDSDNQIGVDYLDKLFQEDWREDTFLMPCWAKPTFDYRAFANMQFSKSNVAMYMDMPFFSTMLNCANYFVNKDTYLKCFDENLNPHTADSLFINYRLFELGGKLKVVDGMMYNHLIHDGSHYRLNNHKTGDFYSEVENKLRNMK